MERLEDEEETLGDGERENAKGGEERPDVEHLVNREAVAYAPSKRDELRGEAFDRVDNGRKVLICQ